MAGCLGIPAWREAVSTKRLICTKRLASAVAEGMADPVVNGRAQRRIAALRRALPDRSVAFPRMGRTIRDEYHRKAGHVDSDTPPDNDPGPTPTRGDLEFMADMLGLCEPPCARSARYGLTPTEHLARVVAEDMADPVANARAQDRIAALRAELPIPYPDGAPPGYYGPAHAERLDSGHVLLS